MEVDDSSTQKEEQMTGVKLHVNNILPMYTKDGINTSY